MKRVLPVARILLTNWQYALLWPVGIMAGSYLINLSLFGSIGTHVQGISFAVGLNATRRAFYLGTAGWAVAQSLVFGVLLYLAKLIEHATDGWGVRLAYFDPVGVTHGNSPAQILVYAVPMILASFIGVFTGVAC